MVFIFLELLGKYSWVDRRLPVHLAWRIAGTLLQFIAIIVVRSSTGRNGCWQ
jgi:hypothetical protein